jgi:hypothetical protein
MASIATNEVLNPLDAIYDRLIIIVPYKSPETVKQI